MNSKDHVEAEADLVPEDEGLLLLSWRVHLLRRYPWRGVGAALGILLLTILLWVSLGPAGAVLLGVVLFLSIAPFFLPQEYRLFQGSVHARQGWRWQVRPWQDFQRAVRGEDRILLSPFPSSHPLEGWRGLVLLLAENEDQVWTAVCTQMGLEDGGPWNSF